MSKPKKTSVYFTFECFCFISQLKIFVKVALHLMKETKSLSLEFKKEVNVTEYCLNFIEFGHPKKFRTNEDKSLFAIGNPLHFLFSQKSSVGYFHSRSEAGRQTKQRSFSAQLSVFKYLIFFYK